MVAQPEGAPPRGGAAASPQNRASTDAMQGNKRACGLEWWLGRRSGALAVGGSGQSCVLTVVAVMAGGGAG
jgi:hypothetical protein